MEVEDSEIADNYEGFGDDKSLKEEDILSSVHLRYSHSSSKVLPKIRGDINKFCRKNTISKSSSK